MTDLYHSFMDQLRTPQERITFGSAMATALAAICYFAWKAIVA